MLVECFKDSFLNILSDIQIIIGVNSEGYGDVVSGCKVPVLIVEPMVDIVVSYIKTNK